ncbi:MAG: alpha/beta fold hydrolase [Flavobacteriales bacterium]|nr:alpha/beta fold hydrolase [Flavobacteriales bacterium]
MTRTILLLLIALLTLSACNVPRKMAQANTKAYEKNQLVPHTFTDAAGPHFTWASHDLLTGTKPTLLLVHGIMSSSAMWSGNLAGLGKDFELIVPDLIGHGKSTKQWSGNSIDQQVAHLALNLDSLGVKQPVYVVGNSYGGAIAANFAEQHPERVRALVIYDGPASDYTLAIADSVARSVGAADLKSLFTPQNPDEQYRLMSVAMNEPPKVPGFARKQLFKHFASMQQGYLGLLQDLLDRADEYATKRYLWTMPTYVIWGEGDRLIPASVGRAIAARNELPKDHLIMIPKAGHVANVEQPSTFEGHLLRILHDGPCVDTARAAPGPCTREYRPLCGCNGITYGNLCEAWRAGVHVVAQGPCATAPEAPCPDPALRALHKDDLCTMDYTPVCGCDGKTYPNACVAQQAGVRVVSEGECE